MKVSSDRVAQNGKFCIIFEVLISSWKVDKKAKRTPLRLFTEPGREKKNVVLLSKNRRVFRAKLNCFLFCRLLIKLPLCLFPSVFRVNHILKKNNSKVLISKTSEGGTSCCDFSIQWVRVPQSSVQNSQWIEILMELNAVGSQKHPSTCIYNVMVYLTST